MRGISNKLLIDNDRENISVDFIARLKLQEVEWPRSVSIWENRTEMLEALKILVVYIHGDLYWGAMLMLSGSRCN
jgi:hypothetical protein